MADIQGLNTVAGGSPNIQGPSFEDTNLDDRQALQDANKRNLSLGLLAAGLATLGGKNPGQGGLVGLQMYEEGEQNSERGLEARQKGRAQQAYQGQQINLRQQQVAAAQQKAEQDLEEKKRHDLALEGKGAEQEAVAQQNANTGAFRAHLEASRVNLEGARQQHEYGAGGVDTLAPYRNSNVGKLVPLPSADIVKNLPIKDSSALVKEVIDSYSKLSKTPSGSGNLIRFTPMGDGKIHKIVVDKATGETKSDTAIGPVVPRASKANAGGLMNPDAQKKLEAAEGVPAAATSTTNPTPAPASTPTPAPTSPGAGIGKKIMAVDSTKYPDGEFRDKKTGKKYIVKGGNLYEAAGN